MSKWTSPTKQRKKLVLNCKRKVSHLTQEDAEATMKEMVGKGLASSACRAYPCDICRLWHWGHPTGFKTQMGKVS